MMSRFVKAAQAAVQSFRHGGTSAFWGSRLRRTRIDYRREVGDLIDSSVVVAPVQWVQRALPEARLAVMRRDTKGKVDDLIDHPMLALIQNPNEFYDDVALMWATVMSLYLDGNAYWRIVRNRVGRPAELWYIPHWMMDPKWPDDGTKFISHYRYTPGGGAGAEDVAFEDVVHFRHGINPRNMRKGLSPLDSAIREIFGDLEASNFVAALLKNMGVPGVVISPKGGAMPTPQDVEATKTWFAQAFGGDNRGKPLVMGAPTEVQPYGFNPQQMNMSESRDVAEERVCALVGVPAAVVGFGAGLQSTKVGATMSEMRRQAWENGVLPIGKLIAGELKRSLLPDFMGQTKGVHDVVWDTSAVPAMQEDQDKKADRLNKMVTAGWVTVYEARDAIGFDVDDSHRIYLRPISVIEVPADGVRRDPAGDAAAKGRGAKHGDHGPGEHRPAVERRASEAAFQRGLRFAQMLEKQQRGLQAAFEKPLITFFGELGQAASDAALEPLRAELGKARGTKSDDDVVTSILRRLGIPRWASRLKALYEAQFLNVAEAHAAAAADAGLGASMPDMVARAIVAAGGRRSGLIDLEGQTRAALFDALAEGRAAGEGAEQLAARILPHVEGGPWLSPETRARIIARTEAKFAQNISTIERGREAGVTSFIIFDGRLGPGRSKPDHIARDGLIATTAEAVAMAEAEHPNGTLSFAPNFEED